MALAKEDIEEIKDLIVAVMAERRPETLGNNVRYELEIRERIVRVEVELKHQRELMLEGFKQMDSQGLNHGCCYRTGLQRMAIRSGY